MAILMSIHKNFIDKIFSGNKPFDFRNILPKNLSINDKIYFYETSKNNGCRKIVGEACVEEIISLLSPKGEYPIFGAYNFIDCFCQKLYPNEDFAEKFKECRQYKIKNYKFGSQLDFALSPDCMEFVKRGEYPPTQLLILPKIAGETALANNLICKCDDWLREIGFYNNDTSYWKYAIKLCNIQKYESPLSLAAFTDKKGNVIKRPPQSWMYCNKNI